MPIPMSTSSLETQVEGEAAHAIEIGSLRDARVIEGKPLVIKADAEGGPVDRLDLREPSLVHPSEPAGQVIPELVLSSQVQKGTIVDPDEGLIQVGGENQ